jgi:hypothetical protein
MATGPGITGTGSDQTGLGAGLGRSLRYPDQIFTILLVPKPDQIYLLLLDILNIY